MRSNKVPRAFYNGKIKFNPYQYKPLQVLYDKEDHSGSFSWNGMNLLITDEVGVGKTFEAGIILDEFKGLFEKDNSDVRALIICPVKLVSSWCEVLHRFFGFSVSDYQVSRQTSEITVVPYSYFNYSGSAQNEGNRQSMETQRKEELNLKTDKREMDNATVKRIKKLNEEPFDILILDEAHYIRNGGRLYNCVKELIKGNSECSGVSELLKIFMTGTPVFNGTSDYDNITSLLGSFETTNTLQCESNCYENLLGIHTLSYDFTQTETEVIDHIFTEDEDGRAAFGRLTGFLKRLSSSSFYSLKKFVDGLLSSEGLDIYDAVYSFDKGNDYDDYYEELASQDNTDSIDVERLNELKNVLERWQSDSMLDTSGDSKYDTLEKKLKPIVENRELNAGETPKAIVFTCFLSTADYLEQMLAGRLKNCRVLKINGSMNRKQVEETKHRFAESGTPAVLICSDAVKEGHNFQFCQHLFHYDLPYTPAALGQRNGRIYRMGQQREPQAYYLLSKAGYDNRLFGEIIVNKCKVVKDFAKKGLVPEPNILPDDAQESITSYIEKYLNGLSVKKLRSLLNDKFGTFDVSEDGADELVAKAKELYSSSDSKEAELNPDTKKIIINFLMDSMLVFDKEASKMLHCSFLTEYDRLLRDFLKKYFDINFSGDTVEHDTLERKIEELRKEN